MINRTERKFNSSQVIVRSFLTLILAGTLLLMFPISSSNREWTPFVDSLFTATSASCVTGLVVYDTTTHWSLFGQMIILTLIQIGGLGVITVATLLTSAAGKRIGLFGRQIMQDSISANQVGGIIRTTKHIFIGVCAIELLGAFILSFKFIPEFGMMRGIWYSIFHSISAFCNAGFDLMGVKQPFSSLASYNGDLLINIVIPLLIIIGGIGFATWHDIVRHRQNFKKYSLQSKIVLTATIFLLLIPFLYFYSMEFGAENWNHLSSKERILMSFFQTVAPRTAGFSTVDASLLNESSILLLIALMLIGGATGSTAGGIKINTVAIMLLTMFSVFKQETEVNAFKRRIPKDIIKKAAAIVTMYIVLFLLGTILLNISEGLPALSCAYEVSSAIATVGASMGATPTFNTFSKLLITALMFCGRVGGLTIIFAAGNIANNTGNKYPEERIQVG